MRYNGFKAFFRRIWVSIRTIKLRIYPNKTQQNNLIKIANGVNEAWNYLNKKQAERFRAIDPIVVEEEEFTTRAKKKIVRKVYKYDSSKKAKIIIPYKHKNGFIMKERLPEGAIYRWEIMTHFLGQYTDFGKYLSENYGVQSATNVQVCEQFSVNVKLFVKTKLENYVNSNFLLKNRNKANWIPFNNGQLTLVDRKRIKIFGEEIRVSLDNRNLKDIIDRLDPKIYSTSQDIAKALKSGSLIKSNNKWFLQVAMDIVETKEVKKVKGFIGIDPGFNTCMTTSDGDQFKRPDISLYDKKIRDLHKKACKSKGGKRRVFTKKINGKQKCVSHKPSRHILKKKDRLIRKVTEKKRHWEWMVANEIVSKGKDICIGDFGINGMKKIYGSSVNREAIFTLWNAIESKAAAQGINTFRVSEYKTTIQCSSCGEMTGPKGKANLGVREWRCSSCNTLHQRDVNAAINIMKLGEEYARIQKEKQVIKEENSKIRALVKESLPKEIFNEKFTEYDLDIKIKRPTAKNKDFIAEVFKKGVKKKNENALAGFNIFKKEGDFFISLIA